MNKIFGFLFCLLFLNACSKKYSSDTRDILINLENSEEGLVSNFVDSFDYVLINYSDSLPIIQPYKLAFHEDLIFIEDGASNNIFITGKTGEVVNIIKSNGVGPKEFNYIDDFQINENEVIIKDTQLNKFIAFDFEGNFLYEEAASNKALNFYSSEDFKLHFFNNRANAGEYNFQKESNEGVIKDSNYPITSENQGKILSLEDGFVKDTFESQLIVNIPFTYDIAFFDLGGNLSKIMSFNFGKNSLSNSERKYYRNGGFFNEGKSTPADYVEHINQFFAVQDKYFMFVTNGKKERHVIELDREFNITKQYNTLENDIDGIPLSIFPRWNKTNSLVQRMPSTFFLNSYLKNEDLIKSKFPNSKIHDFVKDNIFKLERDWLVLVFWNLKT